MQTKAETAAEAFSADINIADYLRRLADNCETYTQNEFTFDDGSTIEMFHKEGEEIGVRTFVDLEEYEASEDGRPERPARRVGRKLAGVNREVIIPRGYTASEAILRSQLVTRRRPREIRKDA